MCERPDAYVETTRRARKEHRCVECHKTIAPGELYQYVSGVWEGSASSFKTCLTCDAVRSFLSGPPNGIDCIAFGDLFTVLREDVYLGPLADVATTCENAAGLGAALGYLYADKLADADGWDGEREGDRYPRRAA